MRPRRPATPDEELIGAYTEFMFEITDATRVERMAAELEMGFYELADVHRAVSVFGSARNVRGSPGYELAREVGRRLGAAGFAVITGGGPGAMEAANRGARDVGALSVGLSIDVPSEFDYEHEHRWIDRALNFHYFFCGKVMFVRYANAFVVLPGGYGTFDELFEALCLIQTEKIRDFPIVLVGTEYWSGLIDWLRDTAAAQGMISPGDLDLLHVTDDLDLVVETVLAAAAEQGV